MSFEEFVAARLPALLRYAVVLTGDRHLAEDLVQDVLITAHRKWRRISAVDRPDQYVFRMVTNAYLSWRRRWSTRTILLVEPPDRGTEPPERPEQSQLWLRLAELPRQQRAALVLRYYEGMSVAETADVLGWVPAGYRALSAATGAYHRVGDAAGNPPATSTPWPDSGVGLVPRGPVPKGGEGVLTLGVVPEDSTTALKSGPPNGTFLGRPSSWTEDSRSATLQVFGLHGVHVSIYADTRGRPELTRAALERIVAGLRFTADPADPATWVTDPLP